MLTVKTPKPEIITGVANDLSFGGYCWACEHKKYGIRTLGDTKQEAIADFQDCIAFELKMQGLVSHESDVHIV